MAVAPIKVDGFWWRPIQVLTEIKQVRQVQRLRVVSYSYRIQYRNAGS